MYACVRDTWTCVRMTRVHVCMTCVRDTCALTRRDCEVVDFTRSRVKNNSEFTNLMKMIRIEGYNGK